jgi:CTP synthase
MVKYIFITGGVVSSLGKGVAAASIAHLLENKGVRVTLQKFDPYINVDPGTMSPYQHGEVYVTDDGTETDLDLGHYERFTSISLTRDNNVTTGKIYSSVIAKERHGYYLGQTVQVIPHITDEIKDSIKKVSDPSKVDVVIGEIGGTVGDIESLPFLEAIRQFRKDVGEKNVLYIHLTLVPYIQVSGEIKTKPTQHSVMKLREIGIHPHIILCRTQSPLSAELKNKIALYCDVDIQAVIDAYDVKSVYEVPFIFEEQGLDELIIKMLDLKVSKPQNDLREEWNRIRQRLQNPKFTTDIAVIGKYIKLRDAYKSIIESLIHGGIANNTKVNIKLIDSELLDQSEDAKHYLKDVDGILVPGGFGYRGIEGKIKAIQYARENNIPLFGICLGFQCIIIEIANHVGKLWGASSSEFEPQTPHPVISLMEDQQNIEQMGGTMRLGLYPCKLEKGTLAYEAYQTDLVNERHRHRYEVNNNYRTQLEEAGIVFSGLSPDGKLVEIVELRNHPWFLGVQFHPEFKSKPHKPHPLFVSFVKACLERAKTKG